MAWGDFQCCDNCTDPTWIGDLDHNGLCVTCREYLEEGLL